MGIAPTTRPVIERSMVAPLVCGLAALLVLLGVVAVSDDNPTRTSASGQASPAPTTTFSLPTVATTLATTSTAPPTTIEKVTVPRLVGLRLARAKVSLTSVG